MFNKEIITVKDTLYIVKRKIKKDSLPIVETWKEHLNCDIVFQKDEMYYFCQSINEAQIIENE
jgi:hypothetical protein